jgi:hypothetical protein
MNETKNMIGNDTNAFFNDLENIYTTNSIYRAIVVTDINCQEYIKKKLDMYNHTSIIINDNIKDINYENIDCRVVIVDYNFFKTFIDHLNEYYDIINTSYNLIAFSYDINDNIRNKLINYYHNISYLKHNTIIM